MVEPTPLTEINVPFPETETPRLRLGVGACRLTIRPGEGEAWVTGTYDDPAGSLPLRLQQDGGTLRITQSYTWPEALGVMSRVPRLDLALGKGRPYELTLEVGANEGRIDLGGLPLTRLEVKHGAGKQEIVFSAANPQPLQTFAVSAGAAALDLRGLANANFAELTVEGGAAAYAFDFGGTLQRPGQVKISAGMSSIDIQVPGSTAARIHTDAVLGGVDVGDGLMKKEGAFWNEAALAGKTPALDIRASVAMGGIRLRSSRQG